MSGNCQFSVLRSITTETQVRKSNKCVITHTGCYSTERLDDKLRK